jgi:hypothetical protein
MPEANHCRISTIAIRVPLIHGFPNLMSGSIEMYDNNSFITHRFYFGAKINVFADISKKNVQRGRQPHRRAPLFFFPPTAEQRGVVSKVQNH